MVVCHCAAINDVTIARFRREGATVADVVAGCGAGGDCGGCIPVLEDLLQPDGVPVGFATGAVAPAVAVA
jgi:bacterioferritin-associated ferredoxin